MFKKITYKQYIEKQKLRNKIKREKLNEIREKKKQKKRLKLEKKRQQKEVKKLPNVLKEKCHDWVKKRDSIEGETRKGYCHTCGTLTEGGDFQAGHWYPFSTCGALLKYHPWNIHGQCGFKCNINRNHQQKMGVEYTLKMIQMYGIEKVEYLKKMKLVSIHADESFYREMIALYNEGIEEKIVAYLDNKYQQEVQKAIERQEKIDNLNRNLIDSTQSVEDANTSPDIS